MLSVSNILPASVRVATDQTLEQAIHAYLLWQPCLIAGDALITGRQEGRLDLAILALLVNFLHSFVQGLQPATEECHWRRIQCEAKTVWAHGRYEALDSKFGTFSSRLSRRQASFSFSMASSRACCRVTCGTSALCSASHQTCYSWHSTCRESRMSDGNSRLCHRASRQTARQYTQPNPEAKSPTWRLSPSTPWLLKRTAEAEAKAALMRPCVRAETASTYLYPRGAGSPAALPCCRERSLALHGAGGSRKRRELNVAVSSPRSDFGVESGSTATVQIGRRCILFELPPSRKHQAFGLVIIGALFEGWFVV